MIIHFLGVAVAALSTQGQSEQFPQYRDMMHCFMDNVSVLVAETELSNDEIVELVWATCSDSISDELATIPPPEVGAPMSQEEVQPILEASTEARIRAFIDVYRERTEAAK